MQKFNSFIIKHLENLCLQEAANKLIKYLAAKYFLFINGNENLIFFWGI